ncbi:glycosyltransferase family 2 protein [Paracoccaceae bacterium Fryx2]|nr:glycosyltransferase family 2 protein [Paracoccaceae bacterium Fryx2]
MSGGFTVVTTMKNEGAFLLEWVAHHKALGFDAILICTNDCADPTREMALRLQQMGLARHHATKPWAVTSIQRSALKQATRYPKVTGAEWLYVCDADEFLCVKLGDGSVRALVAAAGAGAEVVSVPWRVFGPAGRRDYDDVPVTRQFILAEAPPQRPVYPKSLFRGLDNVGRIGIHAPIARDGLGRDLRRELPGGVAHVPQHHAMFVAGDVRFAQVNHYALRTRDSFLVKRDRGRVNHSAQGMEIDYWDRFDRAEVPCDAIRRYDEAVAGWLAHLQGDAVLAGLHAVSVAWHRERVAALKGRADHADILAAIGERQGRCVSSPS